MFTGKCIGESSDSDDLSVPDNKKIKVVTTLAQLGGVLWVLSTP